MIFRHRAPRCTHMFYADRCPVPGCPHAAKSVQLELTFQRIELLVAIESCWRAYGHGPTATWGHRNGLPTVVGKLSLASLLGRSDSSVRGMIDDLRLAGWVRLRDGELEVTEMARGKVFEMEAA